MMFVFQTAGLGPPERSSPGRHDFNHRYAVRYCSRELFTMLRNHLQMCIWRTYPLRAVIQDTLKIGLENSIVPQAQERAGKQVSTAEQTSEWLERSSDWPISHVLISKGSESLCLKLSQLENARARLTIWVRCAVGGEISSFALIIFFNSRRRWDQNGFWSRQESWQNIHEDVDQPIDH